MSLGFIPDPWAFCLLLALLPLVLVKALPAAAHVVGGSMSRGAAPVASVLVLPEFWVTSSLRRRGAQVPAVLHAYDRVVETVYRGMRSGGPMLSSVHGPSRVRPIWVVVPVVLVLLLWYLEPFLPDGAARAHALTAKCAVLRADDAITGGHGWSAQGAVCPLPPAGPSTDPPPDGSPFGVLDIARRDGRQIVAAGWAADRSALDQAVQVQVHVDPGGAGAHTVAVAVEAARPDVAAARGVGQSTGFAAFIPVDGDRHEVCVYAMDIAEGADVLLGCRDIPAAS